MKDNQTNEEIMQRAEKLAEAERQSLKENELKRRQMIERIVGGIDTILIKENCTWGDWIEVVGQYMKRGDVVFPAIKIKEFLDKYVRAN